MFPLSLCHFRQLNNAGKFLERLARAGCGGVLMEVHLGVDSPRQTRQVQRLCAALQLPFWLMPRVVKPTGAQSAWMLDISDGVRPARRTDSWNVFDPRSAQLMFKQLQRHYEAPPAGIFLQTPFVALAEPFPWAPDIEKYFFKQHGYDLREKWHSLVATVGADDAKIRQDYWETINARLRDFLESCAQEAARLKSTFRHNLTEPELCAMPLTESIAQRRRARHGIEIFPFESWPQLLRDTWSAAMNGALWQAVRLPEEFDEIPAGRYFSMVRETISRFQCGENMARVGMLFPLRSARTHYHPDSHRYARWVGEDLGQMESYLNAMHYEYRFVEEAELGDLSCELLIIPSVTALGTKSWEAVEAWIERGGKVACTGLLPRWSERGRDGELEERISRATKQTLQDVYDGYLAWERGTALPPYIGYPVFGEYVSGGRLCSYTPRLNRDAEDARLRVSQILRESLPSDFASQNTRVIYSHRADDIREWYFLFNGSDESQHIISRWVPQRAVPVTAIFRYGLGKVPDAPHPVWESFPREEGGGVSLRLELGAHELQFFELRFEEKTVHLLRANFEVEEVSETAVEGYARDDVLPFYVMQQENTVVRRTAAKVQLPPPLFIAEEEWHQDKSTFTAHIAVPTDWKNHRVLLEMRPHHAAVGARCNGFDCGIRIAPPYRFDLTEALRCGHANEVQWTLWGDDPPPVPTRLVAWAQVTIEK